jgi:hypothetical protein
VKDWLAELAWFGAAAAVAWLLPKTFLAVQFVAALISLSLFLLEKRITRRWD